MVYHNLAPSVGNSFHKQAVHPMNLWSSIEVVDHMAQWHLNKQWGAEAGYVALEKDMLEMKGK